VTAKWATAQSADVLNSHYAISNAVVASLDRVDHCQLSQCFGVITHPERLNMQGRAAKSLSV